MLLEAKIRETAEFLRRRGVRRGAKVLALEQEMKGFAGELSALTSVPMKEVPFFPPALSPLRNRKILCGELDGEAVVVLEGRPTLFEGFFHRELAFPLRVLASLGAKTLIVATYVLSIDPGISCGNLVVIEDHIDLSAGSTLRGFQPSPDFIRSPAGGFYSGTLREKASVVAGNLGLELKRGVAALVNGPVGPTPAERRMLRGMGAHMVSLTLAAEAATAFQLGMELAAVGVVCADGTRGIDAPWGPELLAFFRNLLLQS